MEGLLVGRERMNGRMNGQTAVEMEGGWNDQNGVVGTSGERKKAESKTEKELKIGGRKAWRRKRKGGGRE